MGLYIYIYITRVIGIICHTVFITVSWAITGWHHPVTISWISPPHILLPSGASGSPLSAHSQWPPRAPLSETACYCSETVRETQMYHADLTHSGISRLPWHVCMFPIGSMYGIYANIWGILMVHVTIYSIHGSYGFGFPQMFASDICDRYFSLAQNFAFQGRLRRALAGSSCMALTQTV